MRSLPKIEYVAIFVGKSICVSSTKSNLLSMAFICVFPSSCVSTCVSTGCLKVGIGKICHAKVYATQVHVVCDIKELFQVVRNMQ